MKKFENKNDLINFANQLIGKNVTDILENSLMPVQNIKNKGKIGQIVEKAYFGYDLNSSSKPDFDELGIELKVAPLKELKTMNLTPKERIKLTQINHDDIINNEDIRTSKTWNKISKILIIWYLNNYSEWKLSSFKDVDLFEIENTFLFEQIALDWKIIRNYLLEGKMHYISESTTKYLGVVRNGSGKNELKIDQPFSESKYFRRALAFKICLARLIFNKDYDGLYSFDFFEFAREKIIGKRLMELAIENDVEYSDDKISKATMPQLIYKTLGGHAMPSVLSEFVEEKYGETYTFKVIPVFTKKNGTETIKEYFKLNVNLEMDVDKEWVDTKLSSIFENEFFLILYKYEDVGVKFSKVTDIIKFTLSEDEVADVKSAFEEFRYRYKNGGLANEKKGVNFIKASDKKTVHFRPSAANNEDTRFSEFGEEYIKTAMWINPDVIKEKILRYKSK